MYVLLQLALRRAGDLAGAEFELLLAIDQGARRIRALHELVWLYRGTGQLRKARRRVRQALASQLTDEERRTFDEHVQALGLR